MTTFSTGGSAVQFTTSGSAVSFAVTPASNAFTTSPVVTPGAHASTHGAGGADPITTLGTVAITSASGTATTLTVGTATINAGTATNLVFVTPTIGTATATGGTFTNANLVTPTIGTATMTGGTATTLTAAGEIHTGQSIFAAGSAVGPSLAFTGDTNTGIYSPGADQVGIATAGTARVYVASTGNVTVGGTTDAGYRLDVVRSDTSAVARFINADVSTTYNTDVYINNSNVAGNLLLTRRTNGEFWIYQSGNHSISLTPNATERFKIDGAGLIIGTGTSLGAWTAYTPTLGGTGWAIGSGTRTGHYVQIGKTIHFRAVITLAADSSFGSGSPSISLPVTASSGAVSTNVFTGQFLDASANRRYIVGPEMTSTTVVSLRCFDTATPGSFAPTTSTAPFTWQTSDTMTISGTYEAA